MQINPFAEFRKPDMGMFHYSHYVDETRLYFAYFLRIPTLKVLTDLQGRKVLAYIEAELRDTIISTHRSQEYRREKKRIADLELFFLLKNKMIIFLGPSRMTILHSPEQEDEAQALFRRFLRFQKRHSYNQEIRMVVSGSDGLETQGIKITRPRLDLSVNYNDDLLTLHKKILPLLKTNEKSGIYLFHGAPGTGKSTYIRYLIRSIKKKVVFIPPSLAGNFDAPQLSNLLIAHRNTVFVIEDAEQLLTTRDSGRNSAISMLLNLTDGLLGDSLGIQFIATFNTDLSNIDKALLRKGRLLARYEFRPLVHDKSRLLLQQLGHTENSVTQPMTLADIYHFQEESYQQAERRPIGFRTH